MWRELNIGGVFLPPLLAYIVAALVVYLPLRAVLSWLGAWRWTWNQPLAEMSIYMCVLGLLSEFL